MKKAILIALATGLSGILVQASDDPFFHSTDP